MPDETNIAPPSAMPSGAKIEITGPYELAIVEGLRLLEKILATQPPDVQAAMWTRYLESTLPLHQAALAIASKADTWLVKLLPR